MKTTLCKAVKGCHAMTSVTLVFGLVVANVASAAECLVGQGEAATNFVAAGDT